MDALVIHLIGDQKTGFISAWISVVLSIGIKRLLEAKESHSVDRLCLCISLVVFRLNKITKKLVDVLLIILLLYAITLLLQVKNVKLSLQTKVKLEIVLGTVLKLDP